MSVTAMMIAPTTMALNTANAGTRTAVRHWRPTPVSSSKSDASSPDVGSETWGSSPVLTGSLLPCRGRPGRR